jgi:amino acid adenylation domain-containing protein
MLTYQYIEEHSISQPEEIALKFKQSQCTYLQLHQQTNQLARYLNSLGVSNEDRVAVCLEPSLEITISLLGIFKVGGVYVPFDPSYPSERLANILAEIQPKVVITQTHLLPNLPVTSEHIFCVDKDWQKIQNLSKQSLEYEISPHQTAYIIYTSGTTGKPKGVMVSHSNLLHYILVAQKEYSFNAQDLMPAIARFTFSISLFELLSPLVAGGTLLILERDRILDFERMVQVLEQITVIHAGPSLLRSLLTYIEDKQISPQKFQSLRHVSTGGDMVPVDILERMKKVFRHAEIFVIYGCSEVSCMGCTYTVPLEKNITKSLVGQSFNNVSIRLYDEAQSIVPIGTAGEIYIGGAGVAKGYLYREELTQAKFIVIDGACFYRTGDIGRFDEDGNLEILGRADFQIKLRGIRIELNEIETFLRQAPGVKDGVVSSCELESGEKGLVAYVVLEQGGNFIVEIRRFLMTKLPDYMVPTIFMELEALPLNMNQKLDRLALPAPTLANAFLHETAYIAPRNELEEILANIYARTLKIERIGIYDNFFELGGHSLMAAQVIYRLQEALETEISISQLFEQPTIASLAEYLTTAKPNKDESYLTLEASAPRYLGTHFPLSSSQQQLWFLTQLEGGNAAYNIALAFKIVGALDISNLEKSLTEIVRRHNSLRTIFPIVDGVPVQQVLPSQLLSLQIINLQSLMEIEQTDKIRELVRKEAQQPFNLTKDLLIRSTLLQLGETSNILLLTVHHIVADDWSLKILQKELTVIYTAFQQDRISPLKELDIQYADYVHWQQKRLNEEFLDQQLGYWKKQLAYAPPLLDFPLDRPRPATQNYRGETEFFTLDLGFTRQIKILSQRTGVTLFMFLMTAFAILLSRYSRQQDLVIGTPIANRSRKELESLIGCFINLLSLRIDLTGDPTFIELVQRVRQISLGAYAHQDLPFGKLVEKLRPRQDFSYSPIFQVMFVLQNAPIELSDLVDLQLTPLDLETGTSQYDLTLMMEETEVGLRGSFEYNSDLLDRATIRRLVGHFQVLLDGIVANPSKSIEQLPMLTEREQRQLLIEWNNTSTNYPRNKCVHQLFEEQVEQTPDAIAVVFQEQQLTYRELNWRANQLAYYLQRLGVKPDVLVGICLERSLEMIIGILGILKAGGAYVPLDPNYPKERIEYMLEDTQVKVLLTQQHLIEQLHTEKEVVIFGDSDWAKISKESQENPICSANSENIAYINYTSGSTGKPKGIETPHRGITRLLFGVSYINFNAENRFMQMAPISFDASTLEIWGALLFGAQCVLFPERVPTAKDLREAIQKYSITTMWITSALFNSIIDTDPKALEDVSQLLTGGEALSVNHIERAIKALPSTQIINGYGPTESTTFACCYQIPPQLDNCIQSIPIGKPIGNTQIYILDSFLQPVPIGISGEIYIGGDGLARGYLNRLELTEEKFIPNPFGSGKLYKSGDIARYKHDGNIEYIGRIDNQVKIRGFRIEIGEIESVLSQHPNVQSIVVTVIENIPSDKRLVAYVVAKDKSQEFDLKSFLSDRLPSYMIPTAFVFLEVMPITLNGKIDYRRLPAPDTYSSQLEKNFVPPSDPTQKTLAKIWSQILGVERVGINDNFFELGGHSLLSVRLLSVIEKTFNYQIPLSSLFKISTIAEIAELIDSQKQETICDEEISLGLNLDDYRALLSHSAGKTGLRLGKRGLIINVLPESQTTSKPFIWIGEVRIGKRLKLKQPLYVMPGASFLGSMNTYNNYISVIASLLVDELLSVQSCESYSLGGYCYGGLVALEMAQKLRELGKKVDLVALVDSDIEVTKIYRFANTINFYLGTVRLHLFRLSKLSLTDKWEYVISRIKRSENNINDHELKNNADDAKFVFTQEVDDLLSKAVADYRPKAYSGKVLLVIGTENFVHGEKDLKYFDFSWLFPHKGWVNRLQGEVHVSRIKCDHLQLMEELYCEQVGAAIQKVESLL